MARKKSLPSTPIQIDTNRSAAPASPDLLSDRIRRSRGDRAFLSRCVAFLLLFLAIAHVVPSAFYFFGQGSEFPLNEIPRWIFIQLFLAFLHTIYAIFLMQISDWSSLRAVSFVMLILATMYGFVAAVLFIRAGEGEFATFLQLPFSIIQQAKIWSVVMLIIELLGSYVAGVEAMNWKRMERLFRQVAQTSE